MNSKKFMTKENQVKDSKPRSLARRATVLTTTAAALLTLSIFAIGNVSGPQKVMAACYFDSCDITVDYGPLLPGDDCPHCDVSIDLTGPDPEPWLVDESQLLN